jgi:hypothetical protein
VSLRSELDPKRLEALRAIAATCIEGFSLAEGPRRDWLVEVYAAATWMGAELKARSATAGTWGDLSLAQSQIAPALRSAGLDVPWDVASALLRVYDAGRVLTPCPALTRELAAAAFVRPGPGGVAELDAVALDALVRRHSVPRH